MNDLLSSFALGPSWARATGASQAGASKSDSPQHDRAPRGDDRQREERRSGGRDRDQNRDGDRRVFKGKGGRGDSHRSFETRPREVGPAEGVRVTLQPDAHAVHLIGKEIHQVARVYPLFDVARILLAERGRCRAVFEVMEPQAPLVMGKNGESLFLTKEEAVAHLWNSDIRNEFMEEETIEVDPPTGNFQLVARCGISGEWLGPPNFHSYQVNLRRLHRERFSNTPFAFYSSMVRTERGEEAVNAWLETMKSKTRWRIKSDADDAWIDDRVEAERALGRRCFDEAFVETRCADVLASIPPAHLSPSLLVSMKLAGNHARNHPAVMIPAVCRAVEAEHLPVFKRQGKLFTGPSRPHPLAPHDVLAERPGIMVNWIRENKPAKLEGLWKAVLPEGGSAPSADFAADLFWLLQRGHVLLFTDDTLVVCEIREPSADAPSDLAEKPSKRKKKKSKKAKSAEAGATTEGDQPSESDGDHGEDLGDQGPDEETSDASDESIAEISDQESGPAVDSCDVEPVAITAVVQNEAPDVSQSPADNPIEATPELSGIEEIPKNPTPGVDETSGL
jgi:hypothetical protein